MKKVWENLKKNIWKFVGALISDTKQNGEVAVSLGRVCFLAVLIFMFAMWYKSFSGPIEKPPGLMEVFYTLAGYVFGTKAIEAIKGHLGAKKRVMTTLIKIGIWVKKYWYVPVFFIGVLLMWFLTRKPGTPITQTIAEVKAIQAEANVKKLQAEVGTEKAKNIVRIEYSEALDSLDKKQKEEAKKLYDDPAKLAKFLVRTAK